MKGILSVLRFEYKGFVSAKSYRVVTIVFVVAIIVVTSIPQIAGALKSAGVGGEGFGSNTKAALILSGEALTNEVYKNAFDGDSLQGTGAAIWVDLSADPPTKEALAEDIKDGVYLFALHYSGGAAFEMDIAGNKMISANAIVPMIDYISELARKAEIANLPKDEQDMVTRISMIVAEPTVNDIGGNAQNNFFIGYILIMFLMYTIVGYSNFVSSSVITEKTSKAMELLITAVKPIPLMVGKVVGVGCAALTQVAIIIAAFAVGIAINLPYWIQTDNGLLGIVFGGNVEASIAWIVIIYFMLGFFLYAFIMAAFASTVTKPEEAATVITLPMILIMVALMTGFMTLSGVLSKAVTEVLSYIPFFTPITMIARYTVGDAGTGELILGALIVLASIIVIAILAAKIFRMGVMLYGVKATPKQLIKALRNS